MFHGTVHFANKNIVGLFINILGSNTLGIHKLTFEDINRGIY